MPFFDRFLLSQKVPMGWFYTNLKRFPMGLVYTGTKKGSEGGLKELRGSNRDVMAVCGGSGCRGFRVRVWFSV